MKAVTWIRDGTLIDRMPENAVSFALAVYSHSKQLKNPLSIEDLINWAIEKSGISAAAKMQLLNVANGEVISGVENAARYYTWLTEEATVDYFPGAPELIKNLTANGTCNYITSAVRQDVLDVWEQSLQGQKVAPYIEVLGDGSKGQKGQEHFAYVRNRGASIIYAVADAKPEIEHASQFANVPIGFAHVITPERIARAFDQLVSRAIQVPPFPPLPSHLKLERLVIPGEASLVEMLKEAGATKIITGCRESIIINLTQYFHEERLL